MEQVADHKKHGALRLRLVGISLIGIVVAVIANSIVYYLLTLLNTIPSTAISAITNEPITIKAVIEDTLVATTGASIVYAAFLRWVTKPVFRYRILATVLLILSFIYPIFLVSNMPLKMYFALNMMHIVAAATIVGILTTYGHPNRQ